MRKSIFRVFILFLVCVLAVLPTLGLGEIIDLPIDFSPGMRPVDVYEQGKTTYDDPSIHVERKWGKNEQFGCTVYTMDITIANATQLRTESCNGGENGFNSRSESADHGDSLPAQFPGEVLRHPEPVGGGVPAADHGHGGHCLRRETAPDKQPLRRVGQGGEPGRPVLLIRRKEADPLFRPCLEDRDCLRKEG